MQNDRAACLNYMNYKLKHFRSRKDLVVNREEVKELLESANHTSLSSCLSLPMSSFSVESDKSIQINAGGLGGKTLGPQFAQLTKSEELSKSPRHSSPF